MELRDINEENLLSILDLKASEDQSDQAALKLAIEHAQSLNVLNKINFSFAPKEGRNAGDFYKKLGFEEIWKPDDSGEIGIALTLNQKNN